MILNVKSDIFEIKDDNEYNELLNQLNEEKNKNKKLLEELNKEKMKVKELNDVIKIYVNSNKNYFKTILELEKQLNSKDSEINYLKEYIVKSGEEIIAIFFTSVSQDINRPISCKITDAFTKIEEKIYNEYPIYKNCNTYFTVNGNVINKFKTLKENRIKDGNTIIVNIYDDDEKTYKLKSY